MKKGKKTTSNLRVKKPKIRKDQNTTYMIKPVANDVISQSSSEHGNICNSNNICNPEEKSKSSNESNLKLEQIIYRISKSEIDDKNQNNSDILSVAGDLAYNTVSNIANVAINTGKAAANIIYESIGNISQNATQYVPTLSSIFDRAKGMANNINSLVLGEDHKSIENDDTTSNNISKKNNNHLNEKPN